MVIRLLAIATIALIGCTTEEPIDASGTWNITATAGAGNCVTVGASSMSSTIVTYDAAMKKYLLSTGTPGPGDTLTGTFVCTTTQCDVTLVFVDQKTTSGGAAYTTTETYVLVIDESLAITGTGTLSASGGVTCSQTTAVSGTVTEAT